MISNQTDSSTNQTFFPRVSVIVPIYNGEADLPDLISCLRAQTYPRDRVEYLLVDNASRDRTAAIVQAAAQDAKSQGLAIRYLSENQIQSSYAARNAGVRASTGQIIAFTDVDCRPHQDWLSALVQPFVDLTIGLVGGAIVALPGKTLMEKYAERKNILSHQWCLLSNSFLPYAQTANLAIRRQALETIGLFRPYLTSGGDVDICWRMQRQSCWRLHCAEQAIVQHRHRTTLLGLLSQWRRYGRSHQYLYELYGVELAKDRWNLKNYLHRWKSWLLSELPRTSVKVIFRQATFLDLLITPIDIFTFQARITGRREAKLSEQAEKIEWLSDSKFAVK